MYADWRGASSCLLAIFGSFAYQIRVIGSEPAPFDSNVKKRQRVTTGAIRKMNAKGHKREHECNNSNLKDTPYKPASNERKKETENPRKTLAPYQSRYGPPFPLNPYIPDPPSQKEMNENKKKTPTNK